MSKKTGKKLKPVPMRLRLLPMAERGGPALVGLLVRALTDLGAEVISNDPRTCIPLKERLDLTGLTVVIDKPVWVREEEAKRWL